MKPASFTPGWAKVPTAAHYAGVGQRTFRKWLKDGLRYVKAPTGALLIKLEWIDEFLQQYETQTQDNINQIVESALEGVL